MQPEGSDQCLLEPRSLEQRGTDNTAGFQHPLISLTGDDVVNFLHSVAVIGVPSPPVTISSLEAGARYGETGGATEGEETYRIVICYP